MSICPQVLESPTIATSTSPAIRGVNRTTSPKSRVTIARWPATLADSRANFASCAAIRAESPRDFRKVAGDRREDARDSRRVAGDFAAIAGNRRRVGAPNFARPWAIDARSRATSGKSSATDAWLPVTSPRSSKASGSSAHDAAFLGESLASTPTVRGKPRRDSARRAR
jgi:hypothetical protein